MPVYVLTEYPKSGGTWLTHLVSDYLELPFFRNSFVKAVPQVMHVHYTNRPFLGRRLGHVGVIYRDGRDIMVSFYFDFLRTRRIWRVIDRVEDPENIKKYLPKFIESSFTFRKNFFAPGFSWKDFVESWMDQDVPAVRYEDMLENTTRSVAGFIQELSGLEVDVNRLSELVEVYRFDRQTNRKRGQEDTRSFMRKGIAGDWKNHFSKEAKEVFEHYAGDVLIALGYEKDSTWVDK
jgi:hypothetical protein